MSDDGVLIGGREKRTIMLQHWDPTWSTTFDSERQRISSALGEVARRIEHVGSTSVPGLAAKPIIDIQLSVNDIYDEDSYVGAMENAGYVLRVREPGHRMFRTPDLDVQVHVCAAMREASGNGDSFSSEIGSVARWRIELGMRQPSACW